MGAVISFTSPEQEAGLTLTLRQNSVPGQAQHPRRVMTQSTPLIAKLCPAYGNG